MEHSRSDFPTPLSFHLEPTRSHRAHVPTCRGDQVLLLRTGVCSLTHSQAAQSSQEVSSWDCLSNPRVTWAGKSSLAGQMLPSSEHKCQAPL